MGTLNVGIVGCGAIGRRVVVELDRGAVPGARLGAIISRDLEKVRSFTRTLAHPPDVLGLQELVRAVDLVVEAATGEALEGIAAATLEAGKDLMALSCGALLDREDLFALVREHGAIIHVPSGAIAGLDGVASAAVGRVDSATMVTRKPPAGLRGAPGVAKAAIDIDAVGAPVKVYDGPVREACRLFPANVNVSAALSMAGIGADKTTIQIYADPTVTHNTHEIVVKGELGRLSVGIENVPTASNPRTGVLSALSVVAALKRITSGTRVGT